MKLHIINTGSIGNSYVLTDSNGKMLIIDAGVNFKEIQQAIEFKYNDVIGALLTHEHGDHNKAIKKVVEKSNFKCLKWINRNQFRYLHLIILPCGISTSNI